MPSDSSDALTACSCVLMGVSIIAVGLRVFARKQQKTRYLADDWTVFIALTFYIGATIAIIIGKKRLSKFQSTEEKGWSDWFTGNQEKVLGHPSKGVLHEDAGDAAEKSAKIEAALNVLQTFGLAFVKLSALHFYRRVFCVGGLNKYFSHLTMVTIVLTYLWLVVFLFLTGFKCGTHLIALSEGAKFKYCQISYPFIYAWVVSDFLLDMWILALPVPLVLRLHATTIKKLSIFGVFLLGFLGLGASIARVVENVRKELQGPIFVVMQDQENVVTSFLFLPTLENGVSLVAVNLPSLWPLCTSVIFTRTARAVGAMNLRFSPLNAQSRKGPIIPVTARIDQVVPETNGPKNASRPEDCSVPQPPSHALLRLDQSDHKNEAYMMHVLGFVAEPERNEIHVQHTVEVRRD